MKLNQMMKQAKALQEQLKQQIGEIRVEATAGGGMVTVKMNGNKTVTEVKIDPEVVDRNDVEMLQDLITAAVNEASRKVDQAAERIAFHILKTGAEEAQHLARAILDVKERIVTCSVCNNVTDQDPCLYCVSPERSSKVVCVVEEPPDVVAIEKTHEFKGRYHVLMGSLSPLQGIGPDKLKIQGLLERLRGGEGEEVILATNPNAEGG